MKVLIVGAVIAGPTLAYWLLQAGHEPTLVERAPKLREGGYLIDFWGAAFAPRNRLQLSVRMAVMKLMGHRLVANLAMGRSFHDAIELPAFPAQDGR